MTQIVLIRPGSTDFDKQGRIQGSLDIPLSDDGRQQAARLTSDLRPHAMALVYTSPCKAAVETGQVLSAGLGVRLKQLAKLCNLDQGLWEGMEVEEIKRRHPKIFRHWQEHPECVCPPAGESWEAAQQRVTGALDKVRKKHKGETVGLIVPEPLASMVRALLIGPCGEGHRQTSACGSWQVLDADAPKVAAAG